MSWLAANWKHLGLVVVLVLTVTGWVAAAEYRGRAAVFAELADSVTMELVDMDAALSAAEERAEQSEEVAAAAQEVAREAVEEKEAVRVESENRVASAAARARETAVDGMMPVAAFEAAWAERDEAEAKKDAAADRALLEEQRAHALTTQVNANLDVVVGELRARVNTLERRDVLRVGEIEALRMANSPSFGVRLKADWWLAVVGFGIGVAVSR